MPDEQITLSFPMEIDGDPHEVEERILRDLAPLLDVVGAYLDDAAKQLANAERTRIVQADKGLDALQLAHVYDESDRAGALARLTGAAKALCSAAAEL